MWYFILVEKMLPVLGRAIGSPLRSDKKSIMRNHNGACERFPNGGMRFAFPPYMLLTQAEACGYRIMNLSVSKIPNLKV